MFTIKSLLPILIGISTLLTPVLHAAPFTPAAQASTEPENAIPRQLLLQPAQLNAILQAQGKPLILQIGSHTLFTEAHIPGSEYAGAAATPEGLTTLRIRVAKLPKNAPIVLYCGCCPWGRCPNIRPAYRELHGFGFTNVKVLYLAQDFGTDWANKGFPVERGK